MFGQTGPIEQVEGLPAATLVLLRAMDKNRHRYWTGSGLTLSELRLLGRIAEQHRAAPKGLASSLNLTTGAVTAISDRLVERDLVCRVAHPSDRRGVFLELTDSGRAMMAAVYGDFRTRVTAVTDTLTAAEAVLVVSVLYRLAESFGYELEEGLAGSHETARTS